MLGPDYMLNHVFPPNMLPLWPSWFISVMFYLFPSTCQHIYSSFLFSSRSSLSSSTAPEFTDSSLKLVLLLSQRFHNKMKAEATRQNKSRNTWPFSGVTFGLVPEQHVGLIYLLHHRTCSVTIAHVHFDEDPQTIYRTVFSISIQ